MKNNNAGFGKIKEIIKNIKNDIDAFQKKIVDMSSFQTPKIQKENIANNELNPIIDNNSNLENLNTNNFLNIPNPPTKKEKINSFIKERTKRILEVKRQLNFLDGVLTGKNLNENYKNPNYLKLSSFQEILKNDELHSKNQSNKNFSNSSSSIEENKEKILNNLIKEINEISLDSQENTNSSQDFIVTHDFLENLKSQGKEISENFTIKEKEVISNSDKDISWLTEYEDELKNTKNKKDLDKKELIDLMYKK